VCNTLFTSSKGLPHLIKPYKAAEVISQEKVLLGHCPVTLAEEKLVVAGDSCLLVNYKEHKFLFQSLAKLARFLANPKKYSSVQLPVKMPPQPDKVSLYTLQGNEESTTFMEQALGAVVTKGLREVSDNRLKYPGISVKETMLKLFALFLKAENSANTEFMREKYFARMKKFIQNCEVPEELNDLAEERSRKMKEGKWPEFKEKYFIELGQQFDRVLQEAAKEKEQGFSGYLN
jgi:adenylate/nucleoside-diphosphate kinase